MRIVGICLLLSLSGTTLAQESDAAAAPQPCTSEAHRQFDFWVGDWEVRPVNNPERVAYNEITLEEGGCVLVERYKAGPRYTGMSLSFYDAPNSRWHQTWIDNQGNPLFGNGGLREGAMVLESDKGANPFNRVTWTPNDDGSVRQHWQQSTDGQETWTTIFDGIYRKKPSSDP